MPIHQADIHGSKKDRERVNHLAIQAYVEGEADLAEGLDLSPELVDDLRRQAHALLSQGQWQKAIDVVLGLVALGSVHPADPMMLEHCYRALGMEGAANQCRDHAQRMMHAMGLQVQTDVEEVSA